MSNDLNLPWRVELSDTKPGVVGNDGYLIAEAFSSNVSAHIVKCVNSHDALVEALQKLACLGNGDQYGNSDGNCIAQAALAKAQGEQK